MVKNFYNQWSGHDTKSLQNILDEYRPKRKIVWFAGDSSLDNKYWLISNNTSTMAFYREPLPMVDAVNGYEKILEPPQSYPDVAYHLNTVMEKENPEQWLAVNTSVEASILRQRQTNLLPQDCVLRDNLHQDDIVWVSVAGNDVALYPSLRTIWSILMLVYSSDPAAAFANFKNNRNVQHLIDLFGRQVKEYIEKLIVKQKPSMVVVSMVYFPDTNSQISSWASNSLWLLKYNSQPEILQNMTRLLYEQATSKIQIEGVKVVPMALYDILDGTNSKMYVARCEPSSMGGRLMAEAFWKKVKEEEQ